MRKIKEVLRLKYELGLGQRQIARSCSLGLGTVHDYLARAERAGLKWPLPEGWDEERVEAALFGSEGVRAREPERALPDFAMLRAERQKSKHVTLQLLWEEYRAVEPEGYQYSRFCELYRRWRGTQDVVLRQEYKAGEKLFVDWAGATIPIYSRTGGETTPAHLFVAVLGASSYTWAEATADEQMVSWLTAHMRAFEFFGGVPKLVIPDNPKTGVTRACRYDPDLNPTYHEMAMHYGVGVVPARPRKPRDKAKVESGVLVVERWIIAALRHRRFFGIEDLNEAIRELLVRLNNDRSASAREPGRVCSRGSTNPRWRRCRPNASTSANGRRRGSTSTITWSLTATITACRTTWCTRWLRSGPCRRRWRSSSRANAWLRICAVAVQARW